MRPNSTFVCCLLLGVVACRAAPLPDAAVLLDAGTKAASTFGEWDKLRRGDPADLDADGVADTSSTTLVDGTMKLVIDLNHDGVAEVVVLRAANGDERADAFSASGHLRMREATAVAPTSRVTSEDTDGDGVLDRRTTVTWPKKGTYHVKHEALTDAVWGVTSEEDLPEEAQQRCSSFWAEPASCSKVLASALAPATPPAVATRLNRALRGVTLSLFGAEHVHAGSHVDLLALAQDSQTGAWASTTLIQDLTVLAAGELLPTTEGLALRQVTLAMLLEEGETALFASHAGALRVSLRNPDDADMLEQPGRATAASLVDEMQRRRLDAKQRQVLQENAPPAPREPADVGARLHLQLRAFSAAMEGAEHVRQGDHVDLVYTTKDPKTRGAVTVTTVQRAAVLAVGPLGAGPSPHNPLRQVTVEVLPEQAQLLALAVHEGTLDVLLRNPDDLDVSFELSSVTATQAFSVQRQTFLRVKRLRPPIPCLFPDRSTEPDAGR